MLIMRNLNLISIQSLTYMYLKKVENNSVQFLNRCTKENLVVNNKTVECSCLRTISRQFHNRTLYCFNSVQTCQPLVKENLETHEKKCGDSKKNSEIFFPQLNPFSIELCFISKLHLLLNTSKNHSWVQIHVSSKYSIFLYQFINLWHYLSS